MGQLESVKSVSIALVLHFSAQFLESSGGLVNFPVDLKPWVWAVSIQNWSMHSLCFWTHLINTVVSCRVKHEDCFFYGVRQLRTVELFWLWRCGTQTCYMSAYEAGPMWPTDPLTTEWWSALIAPRQGLFLVRCQGSGQCLPSSTLVRSAVLCASQDRKEHIHSTCSLGFSASIGCSQFSVHRHWFPVSVCRRSSFYKLCKQRKQCSYQQRTGLQICEHTDKTGRFWPFGSKAEFPVKQHTTTLRKEKKL